MKTVLSFLLYLLPFAFVQAQHIVALGDSNTWLAGDSCTNPKGWITVLKEQMEPASCRSYARSGATWTHTEQTKYNTEEYTSLLGDDNVIYNQVNRLRDACNDSTQQTPDLILILAGTNDMWFEAKRPQAFSKTAEEVCTDTTALYPTRQPNEILSMAEAIRYDYEMLREFCPEATIVLLTPMQATKVSLEVVTKTGELIDQCGALLQMPVIRLDEVGINSEEELQEKRYTSDGVHTNTDGALLIGSYVAEKVYEMIK
jgi:lysophospholipase L1-like esterase